MCMKNPTSTLALLVIACGFFAACESAESPQSEIKTAQEEVKLKPKTQQNDDVKAEKVKKIFYTIPSPIEMASLIMNSGADFDKSILNDISNTSIYNTERAQALNLGVYGADLSYSSMFEKDQEALYFFSAAQKLSKELGVDRAIDPSVFERANENRENRDSLINIVSETYWSLNSYLKENEREEVSALVIAGGWIESLYLALQHATPSNAPLKQRVAEQKLSLRDLVALLKQYPSEPRIDGVIKDLESVATIYEEVGIQKEKTTTSKDNAGTMVIGGKTNVEISDETIAKLKKRIEEIRGSYIQ